MKGLNSCFKRGANPPLNASNKKNLRHWRWFYLKVWGFLFLSLIVFCHSPLSATLLCFCFDGFSFVSMSCFVLSQSSVTSALANSFFHKFKTWIYIRQLHWNSWLDCCLTLIKLESATWDSWALILLTLSSLKLLFAQVLTASVGLS